MIFSQRREYQSCSLYSRTCELEKAMMTALLYNHVDFVELLLENGVSMSHFLTEKRLEELYRKVTGEFVLPNLSTIMDYLTGLTFKCVDDKQESFVRQTVDMAYFLLILVVFLLAYGVSQQAILFPNQAPTWELIPKIFFRPYFQVYGELFIDDVDYSHAHNDTAFGTPRFNVYAGRLVTFLMALFLLVANILLLNLLIAIFNQVFNGGNFFTHVVYQWNPGKISCKMVSFLADVSPLVSTLSLVFMTLDRFFAVVYPTRASLRTRKIRRVLLTLSWLIPVVYCGRNFYSYRLIYGTCGEFWGLKYHQSISTFITTFYTVAFIIVPLVVLTILYGVIVVALHKRQVIQQNVISTVQQRIRQKQRRRINILAFSIVLAFAVCNSPMYFYVYIVHSFITKWSYDPSKAFHNMVKLSYILAFSNATINPLICMVFNREIRRAVKEIMPHCIRRPFGGQSFDFGRCGSNMRSLEFDQRTPVTTSSPVQRFGDSDTL
ncbi:hypothetical protein QZH41_007500 [Actinostola sp. cb2023]|nr:hypothetical protein QZH41_007500 [Actinostola sp. cb2023]